jgi:hypothetical protein
MCFSSRFSRARSERVAGACPPLDLNANRRGVELHSHRHPLSKVVSKGTAATDISMHHRSINLAPYHPRGADTSSESREPIHLPGVRGVPLS